MVDLGKEAVCTQLAQGCFWAGILSQCGSVLSYPPSSTPATIGITFITVTQQRPVIVLSH